MRTTTIRTRILTGVAGTAVAAGAVIGGFALAGTANAEPAPNLDNLKKCSEYINPDGSPKPIPGGACLPTDPYSEPGLTLAQRKALINTDPNTRASGSAQEDFRKLEEKFGK